MMEREERDHINSPEKYIEQYLFKKEYDKKWVRYWVILQGRLMMFYSHRYEETEKRDAFKGYIELGTGTKCLVSKRKKYSFPFFVNTGKSKHYFKCPSPLQRHQWLYAIQAAIEGRGPATLPHCLDSRSSDEFLENDADTLDDSSDIQTDDSSQGKEEEHSLHGRATSEPGSQSRVILVAAQPNQHKMTNFLGDERSPLTANGSEKHHNHPTKHDFKNNTKSEILTTEERRVSDYCINSVARNRIVVPKEEIRIHQSNAKNAEELDDNSMADHDREAENNKLQVTPGYAQCGRYVLNTSATGVTTVDLTKKPTLPQPSMKGPKFSNTTNQMRSRLIRSADWQRGRLSLSALENRPRSQGNTISSLNVSDRTPEREIHLSANSRFSRHLVSSAPDIGAIE